MCIWKRAIAFIPVKCVCTVFVWKQSQIPQNCVKSNAKSQIFTGEHAPGPPYFATYKVCGYHFAPPPSHYISFCPPPPLAKNLKETLVLVTKEAAHTITGPDNRKLLNTTLSLIVHVLILYCYDTAVSVLL